MKFSQVAKGTDAERPAFYEIHGQRVDVVLRPLSALEEMDAVASAIRTAKSKGAEPKDEDPVYDAALMAATLELATLDPDSPASTRAKHFDGGTDQVLALDPDTLAMLFEVQQAFQEECSPSIKAKSVAELFELAREVADKNDPFSYARMSPRTRFLLQRTTGALLLESHVLKPSSTGSSSTSGPTGRSSSASVTSAP